MNEEGVKISTATEGTAPTEGSAGLRSQCPGMPTTVSAMAIVTGGIGAGNVIKVSIGK